MDVCLVDAEITGRTFPPILLSVANALRRCGLKVGVYSSRGVIPPCEFLLVQSDIGSYSNAIRISNVGAANVVICGSYATAEPVEVMRSTRFDYAIVGDPDLVILKLVTGDKEESIPGLVYRKNGAVVINQADRMLGSDFAPCDYSLWNSEICDVADIYRVRTRYPDAYIWTRPSSYARKKYEVFQEEMLSLLGTGVSHARIADRDFSGGKFTVMAVRSLDELAKWSCSANVKTVINHRLDQKLRSSKCSSVTLNLISGCDGFLEQHKLPSLEKASLAIELLGFIGVDIILRVIVGLPGETIESMELTRGWLRFNELPAIVETFIPTPLTLPYMKPEKFMNMGFVVNCGSHTDFSIDHDGPIYSVPWRSDLISQTEFMEMRNSMVDEFNRRIQ